MIRCMVLVLFIVGITSMGVWGIQKLSDRNKPNAAGKPAASDEPEDSEKPAITDEPQATGEPAVDNTAGEETEAPPEETEDTQQPDHGFIETDNKDKNNQDKDKTSVADKNTADNEDMADKGTNGSTVSGETDDSSYFDDAVFIGDSRTEGFGMYSGLKNSVFYTEKGLMVDTIFKLKPVKSKNGKITILDALKQRSFGKVYIMLGVNELGWVYDSIFIDKYTQLLDAIKKSQPGAVIYVQSILHVSKEKSDKDKIYNNNKINKRNKLLKKMAEDEGVVYLDVNEAVTNKEGALYADASKDGVHLNKDYCLKWKDYLMKHIYDPDEE